ERCHGADSTFRGVMAGMQSALKPDSDQKIQPVSAAPPAAEILEPINPQEAAARLREELARSTEPQAAQPVQSGSGGDGIISAVNVSPEVRDLMNMLGVDKFVKLRGSCDLKQLETTIL